MKSWILFLALGFSPVVDASYVSSGSIKEITAEYGISDATPIELSSITYPFSACPPIGQLYFVRISFQGQKEGVSTIVNVAMETRTQENQERILREIRQNYPTLGLPSCMHKDTYDKISENPGSVLFEPTEVDSGVNCGFGEAYLPTSSCIHVDPLYP